MVAGEVEEHCSRRLDHVGLSAEARVAFERQRHSGVWRKVHKLRIQENPTSGLDDDVHHSVDGSDVARRKPGRVVDDPAQWGAVVEQKWRGKIVGSVWAAGFIACSGQLQLVQNKVARQVLSVHGCRCDRFQINS